MRGGVEITGQRLGEFKNSQVCKFNYRLHNDSKTRQGSDPRPQAMHQVHLDVRQPDLRRYVFSLFQVPLLPMQKVKGLTETLRNQKARTVSRVSDSHAARGN